MIPDHYKLGPVQIVRYFVIVDDSFTYHSLPLTIMSAFKRFMIVDVNCRNHAMRWQCYVVPSLQPRESVSKDGGAKLRIYECILKFAYRITTLLLVG